MSEPAVTIIGSYKRHWDDIRSARRVFLRAGVRVLRPTASRLVEDDDARGWVRVEGDPPDAKLMRERQLEAIRGSNFVFVVNPAGYIGYSAQFECGYAHALGIPVYYLERPFDQMASAPGIVGSAASVVGAISGAHIAPADARLLDDFVRGQGLAHNRRGLELSLQGDADMPWLAHEHAGPIAQRLADHIEVRRAVSSEAAAQRMHLVSLAHQLEVPFREID